MPASSLDTSGLDTLIARLTQADKIVRKAAFDVLANAIKNIQTGQKSGRLYKRGGKSHQASASGESPATDTGNLANSGYAKGLRFAFWEVGFTALYAQILELRRNRPFLQKAIDKVQPVFEKAVTRLFEGL